MTEQVIATLNYARCFTSSFTKKLDDRWCQLLQVPCMLLGVPTMYNAVRMCACVCARKKLYSVQNHFRLTWSLVKNKTYPPFFFKLLEHAFLVLLPTQYMHKPERQVSTSKDSTLSHEPQEISFSSGMHCFVYSATSKKHSVFLR